MLDNVAVVLVRPRFPENIGAAARACANFGCSRLVLVAPERWEEDKALPLATPKGADILRRMEIFDDLAAALAGFTYAFGATARTGGWRRGLFTPAQAGPEAAARLAEGGRVALVFGSEDRGLSNAEVELCQGLVNIPTVPEASSLNLAQSVLLLLYEVAGAVRERPYAPGGRCKDRLATHAEQEMLFAALQQMLADIDYLRPENPDYWMLPVRRLLGRMGLRRGEFNLLMGVCRQVRWVADRARGKDRDGEP
ncbi:MAG: RNA methyltransferase [Thermodesulfobacteriota bacterium]